MIKLLLLVSLCGLSAALPWGLGLEEPGATGLETLLEPRQGLFSELFCADPAKQLDVKHMALWVNVREQKATAKIAFRACERKVVFAANLTVLSVHGKSGRALPFSVKDEKLTIDMGSRTRKVRGVSIKYKFPSFAESKGWLPAKKPGLYGSTGIWPYYSGNLFPSHPTLTDSITFRLKVENLPPNMVAVYPERVAFPSPSYLPAWAVGQYSHLKLGRTRYGTDIGVYHLPGGEKEAQEATKFMRNSFEWFESNLGPYKFGLYYDSVVVKWGPGESGGMEYEPLAHIEEGSMRVKSLHTHEAGHAWYGDGVRIATWNDFVLSEGTNSYIAARAYEHAAGEELGRKLWNRHANHMIWVCRNDTVPVLRRGRGVDKLDILKDGIFSLRPYVKGAFFYRMLGEKYGRDRVTGALSSFYKQHVGHAMRMKDLLAHFKREGLDPKEQAETWLYGVGLPHYIFHRSDLDGLNNTGLSFSADGVPLGNFHKPFDEKHNWTDSDLRLLRTHLQALYLSKRNLANICQLIKNVQGQVEAWCDPSTGLVKSHGHIVGSPDDEAPEVSGAEEETPFEKERREEHEVLSEKQKKEEEKAEEEAEDKQADAIEERVDNDELEKADAEEKADKPKTLVVKHTSIFIVAPEEKEDVAEELKEVAQGQKAVDEAEQLDEALTKKKKKKTMPMATTNSDDDEHSDHFNWEKIAEAAH